MTDERPEEREAQIRARCEAATPGPWSLTLNPTFGSALWGAAGECLFRVETNVKRSAVSSDDPDPQWLKDARFARHARSDIPWLLAALAREQERASDEAVERWLDDLGRQMRQVGIEPRKDENEIFTVTNVVKDLRAQLAKVERERDRWQEIAGSMTEALQQLAVAFAARRSRAES